MLDGGGGQTNVSGSLSASSGKGKGGSIAIGGKAIALNGAKLNASGATGGGTVAIGGGSHGASVPGIANADSVSIDAATSIAADSTKKGDGGRITIWSNDLTSYSGLISAEAYGQTGSGGEAEVSGGALDYSGTAKLVAAHGHAGTLLLDPYNVIIQTASGLPTESCASGLCTPSGSGSILTVATLENALANGNVSVSTGSSGGDPGNITIANNLTWATGNLLLLSAAGGITINSGVTISNTYSGATFGAGAIPVVLALRADSAGAVNASGVSVNSFGVTNSGTIDMSASAGAVSIFNDSGFAAVNGVQTANASWTAPANSSLSSQFTTYKLVNGVGDLTAMNMSGVYALGNAINGGGAAFNSNAPLGTFTGVLDGQYGQLAGGSVYGVNNFTLADSTDADVGLFSQIGAGGIVRNLSVGLAITDTNTGSPTIGDLAGANAGLVANVAASGSVSNTGGAGTVIIGGLVGNNSGGSAVIVNSSSSGNVTYTDTSASAGTAAKLGGLLGNNASTAANSISGSFASGGAVTAQYGTGGSGAMPGNIGGLVGTNGNASATAIANSYATDTVSDSLSSGQYIGGLVGANSGGISGTSPTASYASGAVSYNGASVLVGIGGLVGINANVSTAIVSNSSASGNVTYSYTGSAAGTGAYVGGLIGNNSSPATTSVSDSYASGGTVTAQYGTGGSGAMPADVGGLLGATGSGNSNVADSYATEAVNDSLAGAQIIGGLAGNNQGYITGTSTATSYASGAVSYSGTAAAVSIGGLVGNNGGVVTNSAASGKVSYSYTSSSAGTDAFVGGLVGSNWYTASSVSGSSASGGTVTVQYGAGGSGAMPADIGGLIGQNSTTNATSVVNSFSTEAVSDSLAGTQYIGGLVGYNYGGISGATPAAVYASGAVSYSGTAATVVIAGLIGSTSGGSVTNAAASGNVSFSYSSSTANNFADVAGLIGFNSGTLSTSNAGGTVTAQYGTGGSGATTIYTGGMIAYNSGAVTNSYATGAVNDSLAGVQNIGGMVGYNTAAISGTSPATSYASGSVSYTGTAGAVSIGGLVGQNISSGTVANSAASGNVSYSYASSAAGTAAYVGGLIGENTSSASTSVSGSYASGAASAAYASGYSGNMSGYVGGLIGQNGANGAAAISTSFAAGNVSSGLNGGSEYVGGLVGYNYSTSAPAITNAYAIGAVSYVGTVGAAKTAGLVGYNQKGGISATYATGYVAASAGTAAGLVASNGGTVTNSYWDAWTTGQTASAGGGTSQTTTQLQAALPSGFSSSTWGIVAGVSYPYLLSQFSGTPQVVAGYAYSDRGVTAMAGASVAGLINGSMLASSQTGGGVMTGANGYYYYLLAPGTISASGSELLTYLTGTTQANTLYDQAMGSVSGVNLYANTLRLLSWAATPASLAGGLAIAMGANSGVDFLGVGSTIAEDSITTASAAIELATSVSGPTSATFQLSAGGNLYVDSGATINNTGTGGVTLTAGSNLYVNAAISTAGGAMTFGPAGSGAVTGALSGSGGVTMSGAGTLTLSGADSYSGATIVNSGVLQAGLASAFGVNSAVTVAGGASLDLNGFSQSIGSLSGAGTVTDSSTTAATLTTGGKNTSTTFSGGIQNGTGVVSLTQNGAGTLTLSGANSYTGATTVSAGALTLTGSWNLAGHTAAVSVASGATLSGSGVVTAATLADSGAGTISLTGANQVGVVSTSGAVGAFGFNDAQSVSLGSIAASGAIVVTTGAGADITIAGGAALSSSASGAAVTLAAGRNFINNAGAGAVATANGNWLIYSAAPTADTFGGLNSNNTAVWNTSYGQSVSAAGNRYVFAYQPTVTFTSTSVSKTYGVNATSVIAADYVVSGVQTGVAGAFLGDSNGIAFSGTAIVTSLGSVASASVAGSPYAMSVSQGSLVALDGYALGFASSGTLAVTPAALTIAANDQSKVYGTNGNLGTTGFTETGLVTANGDAISGVTLASLGAASTATVGTYALSASNAQGSGLSNYTITYVNAPTGLTVTPAALTIAATDQSKVYGTTGNLGTTGFTETGLVTANGDAISGVTLASLGAASTATVGTYALSASNAQGSGLSNYTITYVNAPTGLTVTPAALTIAANNQSKVYGTNGNLGTTGFTETGLVTANGDAISGVTLASLGAASTATVGTYALSASNAQGSGLSNYTITYVNAPTGLTVTPAALTIAANNQSKVYGTDGNLGTTGFTETGLVTANGDAISGVTLSSLGAASTASVGTYALSASNAQGSGLSNYTITYVNAPTGLTVTPVALTIAANNQSKVYGTNGNLGTTGFTETGLVTANGDAISGVTLSSLGAASTATVGTYALSASNAQGWGLSNYTITYVNAPTGLTVTPAALTIAANDQSKVYGTTGNLGTTGFTETGLVTANGDAISGVTLASLGAASTASVGTYSLSASNAQGSGLSNYTITYVNAPTGLTVTPAALTIAANDQSKVYGTTGNLGTTGFTETGLVTANGDAISGVTLASLGAASTATVGTYALSASNAQGSGLSNYTITYVNAPTGLTVTPAALTIAANDQSKVYGTTGNLGTTGFTETGLVTANGDAISGVTLASLGAASTATVGTYALSASNAQGSGLSNYTITYVNAPTGLTVTPAALTIAANNQSKVYGTTGNLGTTGFTETGLVTANGDAISGVTLSSLGAASTATVGTYALSASNAQGSGLSNYTITYVNAPTGLTVTPAALTIAANNQSKVYGTTGNLGTTGFTETGLVTANGDAISGVTLSSLGAASTATVGTYALSASNAQGSGLSNYTITYVNAPTGLTVTPAALTIAANNQSKVYGRPAIWERPGSPKPAS